MNEEKALNVYQKLQKARVELNSRGLKKSGKNEFAKYKYFELSDFLPTVNEIFDFIGLCGIIDFTSEVATLTIHNCDNEESIEFHSPMANIELKSCHAIQNVGAIETYQRRYLYMMALEIVEACILDKTQGKGNTTSTLSQAQIKRLYAIANNQGIVADDVKKIINAKFKKEVSGMSKEQYDTMCEALEKDSQTLKDWLATKQ